MLSFMHDSGVYSLKPLDAHRGSDANEDAAGSWGAASADLTDVIEHLHLQGMDAF